MSDSDSSNDENVEQLREAVNNEFISDSLFSKKDARYGADEKANETAEERPSIRAQLEKEQECHPLNVTPEFQNFVAKHLSKMLDKKLEEMCQDCSECQHAEREQNCSEGGVRLFASSSSFITLKEVEGSSKQPINRRRVAEVEQHDPEEELEKFRNASVTPDWVLSKKGTEGWEKPSKGEVVIVNNKGEIVGHENAKTKIRTNSRGVRDREFHIAV